MSVSRDDWVEAGLAALAEEGLAGVAVEPIARRIGVTKGSFYWHFANRRALLDAVIDRWVVLGTEAVIDRLSAVEDPTERLRLLLEEAYGQPEHRVLEALTVSAEDPGIAATLSRVTERRIAFLEACYRDLGCGRADARRWALTAYSAYVGLAHIARAAPDRTPEGRTLRGYLDHLAEVLDPTR